MKEKRFVAVIVVVAVVVVVVVVVVSLLPSSSRTEIEGVSESADYLDEMYDLNKD